MMSDNRISKVSSPEQLSGGQEWRADRYATHARFVADLGAPVLNLLAPRPGERILDLGCGDGALTEQIASAGADVVGADAAQDLVSAARARGLDARLVDAHALPFMSEYDAVFSNAALHWMTRPDEVLPGVRRALRPGGRFVGEFGGHGNVAAVVVALRAVRGVRVPSSPWYFPTADEYTERLEAHGFRVDSIALSPRPTPLPTDLGGWLDTFAGGFLSALPADERLAARDAVVALLTPRDASAAAYVVPRARRPGRQHAVLRRVIDPELDINILDLGLVYGIDRPGCVIMLRAEPATTS